MATTSTAVIGEFDSFHVGHRRLVSVARQIADRERTALQAIVFHRGDDYVRLSTPEQRVERLLDAGADHVTVVDGSSAGAEVTAARAVTNGRTRVAVMACAPARPRELRWPNLRTILRRSSVEIVEVERATDEHGTPITSDLVQANVADGNVARAAALLGASFTVTGIVTHGDARGRTIGFPTANVARDARNLWPKFGVYAAWVATGGRRHRAAVNIGIRPTVYGASGTPLLEAHLLDFDGDLYDQRIVVHFVDRIRGEQRFDSLDALTSRLSTDVAETRRLVMIPFA